MSRRQKYLAATALLWAAVVAFVALVLLSMLDPGLVLHETWNDSDPWQGIESPADPGTWSM